MTQYFNVEQNKEEWLKMRLGIPTASKLHEIVTATGAQSKSRKTYMYKLAGEIITGELSTTYKNKHMERGHEQEPEAIDIYQMQTGLPVYRVGFIKYWYGIFGGSPDIITGQYSGAEIKTTLPHIQAERLDKGWTAAEHHRQVHGYMLLTGAKHWDVVSYCPGMRIVVKRFYRDRKFMRVLHNEIVKFSKELGALVVAIK